MSRFIFPEDDLPDDRQSGCQWWCAPLHRVERAIVGQPFARHFSVDHFMFMGKLVRRGRPDLYLNKHYFTRRDLNLDDEGHAYRYLPPRRVDSRSHGQYRPHADLVAAIDNLQLPLLPWFGGTDLEGEQGGLTYDERSTRCWRRPVDR